MKNRKEKCLNCFHHEDLHEDGECTGLVPGGFCLCKKYKKRPDNREFEKNQESERRHELFNEANNRGIETARKFINVEGRKK